MVDPYAVVRRLTGHELISPKDAQLLTEAVDGLIDEIGSKDARIAELEADVERLRRLVMAQSRAIHSPEALSRTGAVKVLPRPDAVSMTCGTICLEYEDRDRRDAAYDWLENHAYAPLSALDPAAPEGQQPVAWAIELSGNTGELIDKMVEPVARPYAYEFGRSNGDGTYSVFIERSLPAKPHPDWPVKPLYTRPAEQAVTDAMVEAVRKLILDDVDVWLSDDTIRGALKAAMEAGR